MDSSPLRVSLPEGDYLVLLGRLQAPIFIGLMLGTWFRAKPASLPDSDPAPGIPARHDAASSRWWA